MTTNETESYNCQFCFECDDCRRILAADAEHDRRVVPVYPSGARNAARDYVLSTRGE